jgi:APA family basic amino acid/polyamine antiporter
MVPVSGSAYSYAYVTLGELVAWLIGWSLVLEWGLAASVVAVSWSGYAQSTLRNLGFVLPPVFAQAPLAADAQGRWHLSGAWFDLPAVLVVLACTALPLAGMRTSASINAAIVIAKVLALLVLVVVGAHFVQPQNWQPFVPKSSGTFGVFGWSGVLSGAGTLFFAYVGFDGVATLAEEARNPQRTLPLSLFASLLICTVIYVAVSVVVTGLADYRSLAVPDPLYAALAGHAALGPVRTLIAIVAIVGLVPVVLASIVGQARIFYSMARDGLLWPAFAELRGRNNTPAFGTLFTGISAAVLAGLIPLAALGDLVSIGTLLAFAMVCLGVLVLRATAPQARRPFRTPWVPVVPVLGFLCCTTLMGFLPRPTWPRLLGWVLLGLLIYYGYGRHHSKLRR